MEPQVVLISGGSRGLGEAIVRSLLCSGHSVATFSRKATPFVEELCSDPDMAGRFHFEPVDAADPAALRAFVRSTQQRFGRIDTLINNAAIAYDGVLAMTDETRISAMLDINVRGALVLTKEVARVMLVKGGQSIINISSIIASRGYNGLSVYAATKAALEGMTRALARELGPRGIRVNAVAPGYLDTEMSQGLSEGQRGQIIRRTPLGRLGTAGDIVPCIEFLMSPGASFITGQVLTIDGGINA